MYQKCYCRENVFGLFFDSYRVFYPFHRIIKFIKGCRDDYMSGEGTKTTTAASENLNPIKIAKGTLQKKESPPVAAPEKKGSDRATDKDRKKDVPHPRMQFDDKSRVEKAKKRSVVKQIEAKNRVELFRHLPQYEHGTRLPELESKFFQLDPVHPAVFKVYPELIIFLVRSIFFF